MVVSLVLIINLVAFVPTTLQLFMVTTTIRFASALFSIHVDDYKENDDHQ